MMNVKSKIAIDQFSKHLFWDVDKSKLDWEQNDRYIIKNVLQYGFYQDWQLILVYYGLDHIIKKAISIKELDAKTVSFLATKGKISKDKFACYSTKASNPTHWNF